MENKCRYCYYIGYEECPNPEEHKVIMDYLESLEQSPDGADLYNELYGEEVLARGYWEHCQGWIATEYTVHLMDENTDVYEDVLNRAKEESNG